MIAQLQKFRDILDDIMLKCMHTRIVLYGYDTYSGRFIKWYAEYYHGIQIDWLVSDDMSTGKGYDREIFRPSVFDFGYKDIRNAILWLAQPVTDEIKEWLDEKDYKKDETYYDFYDAVFGKDYYVEADNTADAFTKTKTGKRDIQFMEWLEYKYDCNIVTPISKEDFEIVDSHGSRYSCSTQKEIFPILDHCHIHPGIDDAIFDFGCGKGGAMVSFLDYGFKNVGGVEYETKTYDVAKRNLLNLGINGVELICGDARNVIRELDRYNWFYFFFPFDTDVFMVVLRNILESYQRKKRKLYLIYYTAMSYSFIEDTGAFRLTNQFTVDSRQRVVGIFETIHEK